MVSFLPFLPTPYLPHYFPHTAAILFITNHGKLYSLFLTFQVIFFKKRSSLVQTQDAPFKGLVTLVKTSVCYAHKSQLSCQTVGNKKQRKVGENTPHVTRKRSERDTKQGPRFIPHVMEVRGLSPNLPTKPSTWWKKKQQKNPSALFLPFSFHPPLIIRLLKKSQKGFLR